MIVLTDVATKLQEILNSEDCPVGFSFVVKSQGYHLDSIADHQKGINNIPVFLTMVGGEYNPVPNLHQANYTYGVDIWFPIRFKEDFYALNEYLEETFVGKKLEIGGKLALCNISVAEYGEIVGVHLDQFEEWVKDTYDETVKVFKNEHDISEEYMNMHFNLFATVLGSGFLFGNDVKFELSFTGPKLEEAILGIYNNEDDILLIRSSNNDRDGKYAWKNEDLVLYTNEQFTESMSESTKFYKWNTLYQNFDEVDYVFSESKYAFDYETTQNYNELVVWDSSGTGASVTPASQQLIGIDAFVKNMLNITNFNKSLLLYLKDTPLCKALIELYNKQELDKLENVKLVKKYNLGGKEVSYEFNQVILSYNENIELGSPLSFTITFGD